MSTISLAGRRAAALEQVGRRHEDAGRAEAALERVVTRGTPRWSGQSPSRRGPRPFASRSRPPARRACRHERTATPSSWTVHAPQTPCSQPTWVPVRPSSWRRKSREQQARLDLARAAPPVHASASITRAACPSPGQRALDDDRVERAQVRGRRVQVPGAGRRAAAARARLARRPGVAGALSDRPRAASAGRRPRRRRRAPEAIVAVARSRASSAIASAKSPCAERELLEARTRAGPAAASRSRRASSSGSSGVVKCETKRSSAAISRRPRRSCRTVAAEHDEAERQLGAGVGVCDRAADRAAVSRDEVADIAAAPAATSGVRPAKSALPDGRAHARSPSRCDASRAATRLMSTSTAGRSSRMLSIGTRLWPPASTFASSPCSARSATASSTRRRDARSGTARASLAAAAPRRAAGSAAARRRSTPSASATALAIAAGDAHRVALAEALRSERRERRGRLAVRDRERGQVRRGRAEVVHERAGQQVPVLVVHASARRAPPPAPCAKPPRIWPSTISGFSRRPASCTVT